MFRILLVIALLSGFATASCQPKNIPYLDSRSNTTRLFVDGKPYLILGGELGNSTASSKEDLKTALQTCAHAGLNTVLIPIYWELLEPQEGKFDFSTADNAISIARQNNLKVVFLWFGSWKNSMSCYAPLWVKQNAKRFPRSETKNGKKLEMLNAFSQNNLEADKRAFSQLMQHIALADKEQNTVLMVQVENEIGMIEDARDYCKESNILFNSDIPKKLAEYLQKNRAKLHPVLLKKWENNGFKTAGTWVDVFGSGIETDEIFMAYRYASFIQELAKTAKSIHPIPLYLNAALNSRGRKPGEYPSAGPLAHLIDIWRCAAPDIDIIAPDIYDPGFTDWCAQYHISNNPLFIPEIKLSAANAAQVFYAFGEHDALGFSPFSIENIDKPDSSPLSKSYKLLQQLAPIILQKQGRKETFGLWFDGKNKERIVEKDSMIISCRHDYTLGWDTAAKDGTPWPESGALAVKLNSHEYIIAGTGVVLTFKSNILGKYIGIGSIDEVQIADDQIISVKQLNGDESHQGRHLRIPVGQWSIQHIKLYEY